ncbi:MAG TPA: arginase family protein [Phycicoccus sp.]|nr:arginase family protein [Phycicoccus sp.]
MSRYGQQFGPDFTFLGVPPCDLADPESYAGADVVIVGAPFDGGTSHRPGTRFGPQAIRGTDYLGHDGSRPSLALRTDGLQDLRVVDAGDVEMPPGDIETCLSRLTAAVEAISASGAIPVILGGDHSIAFADATGVANVHGHGRVSMIHFDAHADTGDVEFGSLWGHGQPMRRLIESGALRGDRFLQVGLRGYWPGPETLDWMASIMAPDRPWIVGWLRSGLRRICARNADLDPARVRRAVETVISAARHSTGNTGNSNASAAPALATATAQPTGRFRPWRSAKRPAGRARNTWVSANSASSTPTAAAL